MLNSLSSVSRHDTRTKWNELTDAELVQGLLSGSPAVERLFYDRHVDRVYRLILRVSGRADLAQEWTQDTFVRAFERIAQYRGEAPLANWLQSIARSVTLNGLRSLRRHEERTVLLEEDVHLLSDNSMQNGNFPDLRSGMRAAIGALPGSSRRIFIMHDVEGFTHEEISEALGVAVGTSKSQLSHARRKLRQALAAFAPREGAV